MKKNKTNTIIILFCFISTIQVFSQKFNFKNDSINKNWISLGIGGHYSGYIYDKYIAHPTTFIPMAGFQSLVGFWIKDTYSYNFDFNIFKNYKNFIFKTGLNYFNRKRIYESDSNEIKKYLGYYTGYYQYENIIKFNVSSHNIELPLSIGYKYKKNYLFGSINFSFSCYYKNILIDKFNNKIIEKYTIFDKDIPRDYIKEKRISFYPEIIYYRNLYKNILFHIGIDYNSYYYTIQTGIDLKFNNKK